MLFTDLLNRRAAAALILPALLLAACGGGSSPSTSSSAAGETADAAAAAKVPAAIKSKGTLMVAADASYAPNEFFANDNKTVVGMDVDLANALGQVLG